MKLSVLLIIGSALLASCTSGGGMMMGSHMNGNGTMNHGDMMDQSDTDGSTILPGHGMDLASLPEAKPRETIDVEDGATIDLDPTIVRATINGREFAMYGYNGEFPGPLLKAKQGSTFTVRMRNDIDMPTSIHWHGLRLENENDGAVGLTQKEIAPGNSFTYSITVPDEGIYWYHSHVREDVQQPMGLYGNILVTPRNEGAYSSVNREEILAISDLLLDENGSPVPFGATQPDHALMGRFGNTMLVNGSTEYALDVSTGDVVRFFLTNTANTRTFKIDFPSTSSGQAPARMKLVGGDNGRYEKEQFVDSVTLSPSERAIIDVHFDKPGRYAMTHRTPNSSYELSTVTVGTTAATPSYAKEFETLAAHADVTKDIDAFRPLFDKEPEHTLVLDMNMGAMNGHGGMMMGEIPADGIEWEDSAGMMNDSMMGNMMKWKLVDQATGASNENLTYIANVGDKLKIRIMNKKDSPHPMQHPIHFHGQRFLVLSDNGVTTSNFVWKDTVLVPAGHTIDILLDVSNPGDWMFHCHIAEHLGSGMMGLLKVGG